MRICMLHSGCYPPESRIAGESVALSADDHDVVLLARGDDGDPGRERIEGLDVDRLPIETAPFGPEDLPAGLGYALRGTHSAWSTAIKRLDGERAIDALHVHGLALAKTGLDAGEDLGVPVVLDLPECFADRLCRWRVVRGWGAFVRQPTALVGRLVCGPRRFRRLETSCVERADRLVVGSEEARGQYLRNEGLDPERVSVVRSTVDRDPFDELAAGTPVGLDFSPDEEFIVTYVGPLLPESGLETLLDAIGQVVESRPTVRLLLVGDGPEEYVRTLRERAEAAGIEERLTVAERARAEHVPAHLATSDVCVLPATTGGDGATTLPHALFQYLAAGKPVAVGDVAPLRRVITTTESGLVVPDSHTDLAAALCVLGRDPNRAARLGTNGRAAVESGGAFDAARDAAAVARLYREL